MKALRWHGKKDVRCGTVPDPCIEELRDVIVKVMRGASREDFVAPLDRLTPAAPRPENLH